MSSSCKITPKKHISEIFPSAEKQSKYSKQMTIYLGRIFSDYLGSKDYHISDIYKNNVINDLYKSAEILLNNTVALYYEDHNEPLIPGINKTTLPPLEVIEDFETILDNFSDFILYHQRVNPLFKLNNFDFSPTEDVSNDTENSAEESEDKNSTDGIEQLTSDEKGDKGREYDKTATSEDSYSQLHKDVRIAFNILTLDKFDPVTNKPITVLDSNNLPSLASATTVYNKLIIKVNGLRNEEEFKNSLLDDETIRQIPEVGQINKMLNLENWETRTDKEKEFFIKFHQDFMKSWTNLESMIQDKKGDIKFVSDVKANTQRIQDSWRNNFNTKKISEDLQEYIEGGKSIKTFINSERLINPNTPENAYRMLETLGIILSKDLYNDKVYDLKIQQQAKTIYKKFINEKYNIIDPISAIKEAKIGHTLSNILAIESKFSDIAPTVSTVTPEGERQYAITPDNNISVSLYHLNNAKSIEDLLTRAPFLTLNKNTLFKYSTTAKRLFQEGLRDKSYWLTKNIQNGQKVKGLGKSVKNMTEQEKIKFDFNSFILNGRTEVMRAETSNSFYSVGLSSNKGQNGSIINQAYFNNGLFVNGVFDHPAVIFQFEQYLQGEIDRIKSYPVLSKTENIGEEYKEFQIFSNLSNKLKADLLSKGLTAANKIKFAKEYTKELENDVNDLSLEIDNIPNIISSSLKEKYDEYKKSYIVNSLIQNIEYSIYFSSDPAFFKKKEFHKRIKFLTSTGQFNMVTPTANYLVSSNKALNSFNISALYKTKLKDNSIDFNTKTVKDIMSSSDPEFHKAYKDLKEDFKLSDGQGIISLDYLHELSLRNGFNNEFTRPVFKYEYLVLKDFLSKQPKSKIKALNTDETLEIETLRNLIMSNPSKYSIGGVMKGNYSGSILNSLVDGKAYDKLSLMPLLPSYAIGKPKLEKLMSDMAKGQYAYIKFQSGQKGYDNKAIDIDKLSKAQPTKYASELFKIQISYKNQQKIATSIPTQLVKLVYANMFSIDKTPTVAGAKLYNDYLSTLGDIQKAQTKLLLEKLGLEGNKINYEKFSKALIDEAIDRDMNSNVLKALELNKDKTRFNASIEAVIPGEIEKIITSLADKTLRKFKLPGGDFVLISNALSPKLNFYTETTNGITTNKSECRISFHENFRPLFKTIHPDGKKVETLSRLNEAILNDEYKKKYDNELTVVLNRVPTQELNSMDVGKIVEFISPTMGNVIQLSNEIVVKAGLDFDFDKEKTLLPSLSPLGSLIQKKEIVQAKIDELKKKSSFNLDREYDQNNWKDDIIFIRDRVSTFVQKLSGQEFGDFNINDEKSFKELNNWLYNLETSSDYLNEVIQDRGFDIEKNKNKEVVFLNYKDYNIISENELIDLRDRINGITENIDNQIKFSKEVGKAINQRKELLDLQYQLKKQNLGNYNNIISNYANALLQPERFSELTRPNTAEDIKNLSNEIGSKSGISATIPERNNIFKSVWNNKVFGHFFNAKNMLAPYAKVNTILQIFAYSGVHLNKNITENYFGENIDIKLNHFLITKDQAATIEKDGKILAGKNTNIDGEDKQKYISQIINATVDAAKDPYFRQLMLTYKNVGPEILMSVFLGYPKKTVAAFLSNRDLISLVTKMNNGAEAGDIRKEIIKMYDLRDAVQYTDKFISAKQYVALQKQGVVFDEALPSKGGFFVTYKFGIKQMSSKAATFNQFLRDVNNNDLNRNIQMNNKTINSFPEHVTENKLMDLLDKDQTLQPEDYATQLKIIAHFFSMQSYNNQLRNLTSYLDYDTTKIASIMALKDKKQLRNTILESGIVDKETLKGLESNSIIGKFKNDDTLDDILTKFMPLTTSVSDKLHELYAEFSTRFSTKDRKKLRSLPIDLEKDFLYSTIFNLGNIAQKGYSLLTKLTDDNYIDIEDRWKNFIKSKEFKSIEQSYPVLNMIELSPAFKADGTKLMNFQLIKNTNISSTEENSIIYQFEQLISQNLVKDSGKNERIQNLIKDIFAISIAQSGLSQSYISFQNLIPLDFYKEDFTNSLKRFYSFSNTNKDIYMNRFFNLFQQNNPKYFPKIQIGDTEYKNDNISAQRIKDYDLSDYMDFYPSKTKSIEEKVSKNIDKTIAYTLKGKEKQTYTIKGNKILNSKGEEVFAKDSIDRTKIFANLAVREGRAKIVTYKDVQYVVNNKNQILSTKSGKIVYTDEKNGNRIAILQLNESNFPNLDISSELDETSQCK